MPNYLQEETSPYLRQHAENPVNWYPWRPDAFEKARREDKPIFLSIGYSTCHWCHVMAQESFSDPQVATLLNEGFVSIKVDREARPDIDSIYLSVCQAFTGSSGWPTSIFMTPDQKPFFAGTYFPKESVPGRIGMLQLLPLLRQAWDHDRETLLTSAEQAVAFLRHEPASSAAPEENLLSDAVDQWFSSFDPVWGGFGAAPKFPMGHTLLFLLSYQEKTGSKEALTMAETTLEHLFRGGLFDHLGGGFSRYSTDQRFAIPHFEKMLYDNALLILAYCKAYSVTKRELYCDIAIRTASYVLKEMTLPSGAFASAQDADSKDGEGSYYAFRPEETISQLGKDLGSKFNTRYDITSSGNFHGKSIPNLLHGPIPEEEFALCRSTLYGYRLSRNQLRRDDKVLTGWNGLMIAAFACLYRVTGQVIYREAAEAAWSYLSRVHWDGKTLFASSFSDQVGAPGFLDDYAFSIWGLLSLYEATLQPEYLDQAQALCYKVLSDFSDDAHGGFYLTAQNSETLLIRPKELADSALPSGNTAMAYVLVRLSQLTGKEDWTIQANRQLTALAPHAGRYPTAYPVYLLARLAWEYPPEEVTIAAANPAAIPKLPWPFPLDAVVKVLAPPPDSHPLLHGKTTCYICKDHTCLPPKVMEHL